MRRFLLSSLLFITSSTATLTALNSVAYNLQTVENLVSIILFTATGCAACDNAMELLNRIDSSALDIPMGMINCSEEPKTCDEARIFAVPKLMLSVGSDKLVSYEDGWHEDRIASFIKRQFGPTITALENLDDEEFHNPTTISVVAFIAADDIHSNTVFSGVAERWRRHFKFNLVVDPSIAASWGIEQPGVMLFKSFDDKSSIHHGIFQTFEIEEFLRSETIPLIKRRDPLLYESLVETGIPLAHILCSSSECSELAAALHPLAKRLRSRMSFIIVDSADHPSLIEQLRLASGSKSGLSIENTKTTRMHPMTGTDLSVKEIEKFVARYLKGDIEPFVSTEEQDSDKKGPLVRLVGSDFEDFTFDRSRDVLTLFDVPWCEYCKELHGHLEKLGRQYQEQGLGDKVAVARIDVSLNDVPVRITKYPTLNLWRADDNSLRSYNGTYHSLLTVEQLAEFIRQEGANAVELSLANPVPAKDEL